MGQERIIGERDNSLFVCSVYRPGSVLGSPILRSDLILSKHKQRNSSYTNYEVKFPLRCQTFVAKACKTSFIHICICAYLLSSKARDIIKPVLLHACGGTLCCEITF